MTGKELGALLFGIHHHDERSEKIIYFEEDLLPILLAAGLPQPEWGGSMDLDQYSELESERWLREAEQRKEERERLNLFVTGDRVVIDTTDIQYFPWKYEKYIGVVGVVYSTAMGGEQGIGPFQEIRVDFNGTITESLLSIYFKHTI